MIELKLVSEANPYAGAKALINAGRSGAFPNTTQFRFPPTGNIEGRENELGSILNITAGENILYVQEKRILVALVPPETAINLRTKDIEGANISSIFVSPFSKYHMALAKNQGMNRYLTGLMAGNIMAREKYWGVPTTETAQVLADITAKNLLLANQFDGVLFCRDGLGHPNWNMRLDGTFSFKPISIADYTFSIFGRILNGEVFEPNTYLEAWDARTFS